MEIALFCLIWVGIGFISAFQLEAAAGKEKINKGSRFIIVFLWPIHFLLYLFTD
jgi:hypothetical protein